MASSRAQSSFEPVASPVLELPSIAQLLELQSDLVRRWHEGAMEFSGEGFLYLVAQQHAVNFELWHQEDKARSPIATDAEIASVKRSIDSLNQRRHDRIELIDDAITEFLKRIGVRPVETATANTETPGSVIDRLSIMALRLYHYAEQLQRTDVDAAHQKKVAGRIELCRQQHRDLSVSLEQLMSDILAGKKKHQVYRQLKMYNDPSLNPAIYEQPHRTQ